MMDHKRTIKETFKLDGDHTLLVDCDGKGVPVTVSIEMDRIGCRTYGAELFERAGALVEKLRRDAGNWRAVCEDHGYYEFSSACGLCVAERAAERAAAVAATCGDIAEKAGV